MAVYDIDGVVLDIGYRKNGASVSEVFDIDGNWAGFHRFLDTATVTSLPGINLAGVKQGACTDDTYIYQICFDSTALTSGFFIKYKIADGTYTTKSFSGTMYGHGNDMCYNPNNQHIFVACMTNDGSIVELDTDFNVIQTHYLVGNGGSVYTVWQFCFDRNTNQFMSANSGGMAVYDQNWNYVSWFSMPTHPTATAQGCETDGAYIYRITYNPNYIDVATIDGKYVKTIDLPVSGEPESIMYNWGNGDFYIGRYVASDFFAKVTLYE